MSNRRSTSNTPQARHRASGNERPFMDKWLILNKLMLRNDLSHAEHRVLYLLIAIRANNDTSLCFTSNRHMAEDLGLNVRSIERAKASLRKKGLLNWTTNNFDGTNDVTVYTLPTNLSEDPGKSVARTRRNCRPGTGASAALTYNQPIEEKFYAAAETPELEKWDRWSRKERGKPMPRDRNGGWLVPSKNPPIRELTVAEIFDL